ncbi:MAG: GerMN domain-containing protein [Candidatus Hydrogenedentes bacterium]|nr:GerMN domain-containing protein [Candidatus Hydrogenedentota bacterium]
MSEFRAGIMRRVMLSLWAMATLVLVFVLGLLVREMVRAGEDPLAILHRPAGDSAARNAPRAPAAPLGTREITLYFAAADGISLVPEQRRIEIVSSAVENCRSALRELIAGPSRLHLPVIAPAAEVRALYLLEDGELVIDFSGDLQAESASLRGAAIETLMVYAVVNSLTQPELRGEHAQGVRRVRFLIEGSPPQETFPAHLDLTAPVGPDQRWIHEPGAAPENA